MKKRQPDAKPIRGHIKQTLLRELAGGDKQADLARKYGVSPARITQIKQQYAEQIAEMRAALDDEMAGLWIAQKKNRLAEYQEDIERLNEAFEIEGVDDAGLRVKHSAMRAVAEEMGHLPTKTSLSGEVKQVHYIIDGIDPEDLT